MPIRRDPSEHDDPKRDDSRAVWLLSLGWYQTDGGLWTGHVVTTRSGRYRPMSLDQAFEVALTRSIIDRAFRVQIVGSHVRVALPWRMVSPQDDQRSLGERHIAEQAGA